MNILIQNFKQGDLRPLAEEVKLQEQIDYDCQFIVAKDNDGKILGVAGFNLHEQKYPRFKHILVSKEKQGSRLGFLLMKKMESYFKTVKIPCFISYILNVDKRMIKYAEKWGLKSFESDLHGSWYFKKIGDINV